MSIRRTAIAAVLAALTGACSARHFVVPDKAVPDGAANFPQATLVVRTFEARGAGRKDEPNRSVPELRSAFADYVNAACKFREVILGGGKPAREPAISVDVVLGADHSAYRTWVLDYVGIWPLWPFVPQWGTAKVSVAVNASDSGAGRWTAEAEAAVDYSMVVYSWWRTEPVESAYRRAFAEAFGKVAKAFCADIRTVRVASGGAPLPAAPAPSAPSPAPAPPRPHPESSPVVLASATAPLPAGKVAVLDFRNFTRDLEKENVQYFTDLVRGVVLRGAPRFNVITRENLLVLLQASGKDPGACEGECEVDTGRRIGAEVIVSGDIQKVGTRYKISLRMHETRDGRLISTAIASGASVDALDDAATKAADELVAPLR